MHDDSTLTSVDVHHLRKRPRQLLADRVPIDVVPR